MGVYYLHLLMKLMSKDFKLSAKEAYLKGDNSYQDLFKTDPYYKKDRNLYCLDKNNLKLFQVKNAFTTSKTEKSTITETRM